MNAATEYSRALENVQRALHPHYTAEHKNFLDDFKTLPKIEQFGILADRQKAHFERGVDKHFFKQAAPDTRTPGAALPGRVLKHITLDKDNLGIKLLFNDGYTEKVKMQNCPGCQKKNRSGETNRWKLILCALQGDQLNEKERYKVNETFRKLLQDKTFTLWKNKKIVYMIKLPVRGETFTQKSKREHLEKLPLKSNWTRTKDV